jgi:hypothetical protein
MQLSPLFLSFVATVVLATAAAALRYLPLGYHARFIAGFGGWVVFATVLGVSGILANPALRHPAILYVFIPTFAFMAFLARSRAGAVIASSIPVAVLMDVELLRIIVELFIDQRSGPRTQRWSAFCCRRM